jgi:hypothetical protein
MIALSQEAVRSKDTINHYVLSWREGEQPSPEQVEEAVSIFMDELGWKDHQAIYGLAFRHGQLSTCTSSSIACILKRSRW